jgi:hypothetical protein
MPALSGDHEVIVVESGPAFDIQRTSDSLLLKLSLNPALKGHGFSRAAKCSTKPWALALTADYAHKMSRGFSACV